MTAKKRIIFIFSSLVMCLFMASPIFAQTNLFNNPGFEQSGGFETDYTRVLNHQGVPHGYYAIDYNTQGYGVGDLGGWPNIVGHGGSGRFMMVNGFSGLDNPSKIVWKQTVTVTPNTDYEFSCFVANLNQSIYGQIFPAKLQLKINGQNVGAQYNLPSDNNWHEWPIVPVWNSGSYTQAIVEIHDNYTGLENLGDDFALDDLSFTPIVVYSVDANPDPDIAACLDQYVYVDELANDVILPDADNVTVTIVVPCDYGDAEVRPNKRIRYKYTGGGNGTDQLKYRVTTHGVYGESWVFFNTSSPPQVGNIENPGPICAGGALDIPVPSVMPSADGVWEYCSTPNGTNWQSFNPLSVPLELNGMYIRYRATNGCGSGNSENQVQLVVTNGPTWATGQAGQTPPIDPICAGQSLSLTPPAFNANGSQILGQHWVASTTENGNFTIFNNDNLNNIPASYNGWYIRYRVEGSCGYIYSEPARLLTVNVAPDITGTLLAPDAICANEDLDVTPPSYEGNGTGSWEICQTPTGTYIDFSIQNVSATYNGWYLRYKVSNNCGNDVSGAVQIQINDAPTIAAPIAPPAICAGESFSLTAPTVQDNGSTITESGWQISDTQNGSFTTFSNENVPYSYNQHWIRYYAENDCNVAYSTSVQVTVNDSPLVGAITAPEGICEGEAFSLTTPSVTWRHNDMNTCSGSWEIQIDGVWSPLVNQDIPFEYNGCLIRYKAVNGCDTSYSTNNVPVIVYSTAPVDEGEITACDAMYHHGILCNATGTYIWQDSITPNGCQIQVSWHFTLGEAFIALPETPEECDSYYWPRTGLTYFESTIEHDTVFSNDPQVCDSIFTLDLTINHAPTIQGEIHMNDICVGDLLAVTEPEFDYNHSGGGSRQWEYATSANGPFLPFDPETYQLEYGSYFIRFAVINECDSTFSNVVTVNVNDQPDISGELSSLQACVGNLLDLPEVAVDWHNESQSGISRWQIANNPEGPYAQFDLNTTMQMGHNGHWIRFMARNECDTVFLGPVQVTVIDEQDVTIEHGPECDLLIYDGVTYTESTTIDEVVDLPCPHVVHHEILVNHSDYKEIERTTCQEYFDWHGHHFEHSDETQYATFDTINRFGCDSTVVLKLDFGPYEKINLDDVIACDSYVWDMNPGVVYYESQRDSVFVPASTPDDCPTWYCLNMTIGTSYYEVEGEPMTQCYGFEWHGMPYYEDGIVYDSLLTKITHCDSIVSHALTIIPPFDTLVNMVSCEPYQWHAHLFSENEIFTDTLQSTVTGCDSIVTINFRLDDIVNEFDTVACEPFEWFGYVCDYSHPETTIQHVFQFPMRCDSTVVKHVRLDQVAVEEKPQNVCTPYLCPINGVLYEEPGVFYIDSAVVSGQYGCDSIVYTIRLEVKDSEQIGLINGASNVFVASNLVNGIYRYEINAAEVVGNITWNLSNPDWQIVEANQNYCLVFVTTPGTATLSGSFRTSECGIVERSFEINAGFFGVDNHEAITAKVYPNPTKDQVTIEAEGIESVRLTNMMGQVLEARECDRSESVVLNLNGYSPSVYLLEIKTVYGIAKKQLVLCR